VIRFILQRGSGILIIVYLVCMFHLVSWCFTGTFSALKSRT
jgi:succinate dehydrogenase/fumarate reductase cytochrome b subunit